MVPPENIPSSPENNTTTKKITPQKPPQEQPQKCPRCDSSNTKFCYYNNYSLTQPRHFCKTCRRYWTRGGALRNVPIGGGCRKTTKKFKTTSTSSKLGGGGFESGFKFLDQNLNPGATPGMEFNLGGISPPRLHPATAGVYTQFITSSVSRPGCVPGGGPYFGLDLMGLNNNSTVTSSLVQGNNGGNNEQQITISSIESLSSINQEMHWKLQQQRLGLVYGPSLQDNNEENKNDDVQEKTQGGINLFSDLEINNLHGGGWTDLNNHNYNHNHQQQQQLQFHGLQ